MPRSFLRELKRRKVYRVAVAYAIVGWLLIQIATQVFPFFRIPDWSVRVLVLLVLAGFPITLVLAWAFDATPHGIVRTETQGQPVLRRSRRGTIAVAAIGVAIAVIVGVGYWMWHREPAPRATVASNAAHAIGAAARSPDPAAAAAASGLRIASAPVVAISAKSIAVLPFENLSTDKGNAYFADGMQDLILTKLADIGDLKVISRTSTMQYGSHPGNLRKIARQLGVATILEGSVQKAGNQVLINVQLIDAQTDAHIWAQSYTRTLDNIFGVEGEVAQKVADALKAKLTPVETQQLATLPTQNQQAYDSYLKGEYYLARAYQSFLKPDFDSAIKNYREATEQDPKFALAWARLAIAQVSFIPYSDDGSRLVAAAKAAMDTALTLAPKLAEAHLAHGMYEVRVQHDLDAAQMAFATARALKPQSAIAIRGIGLIQMQHGQFDAAIQTLRQALNIDPRNLHTLNDLAVSYLSERRYGDALRAVKRAQAVAPEAVFERGNRTVLLQTGSADQALALLDSAPKNVQDNPSLIYRRADLMLMRGDYAAARALIVRVQPSGAESEWKIESKKGDIEWAAGDRAGARKHYLHAAALINSALKTNSSRAILHSALGYIYARIDRTDDALEQGRLAVKLAPIDHGFTQGIAALLGMAIIQAQLGNAGAAVPILDRLLAMPSGFVLSVPLLKSDPVWDPIRHDPRFQALLKKYANHNAAASSNMTQ